VQAKLSVIVEAGGEEAVAVEGDQDSVDNHAHLIPRVNFWHHLQAMAILMMIEQKKRGGGGAGDQVQHMTTSKKQPGRTIFSGHF
jgi:hypothetical protein